MQVLPKKDFEDLANHIICGDQVIIRGNDMVTVTSLLMVLKVCTMFAIFRNVAILRTCTYAQLYVLLHTSKI